METENLTRQESWPESWQTGQPKASQKVSIKLSQDLVRACVVIPTYNEADNIQRLLQRIFLLDRRHRRSGNMVNLHVLVVDDDSPDGTAGIVREYAKSNPRVHLLLRKNKEGLGRAYIAGMSHAMELLSPDVILEMDADFSHDPKDIFRLVHQVREGADFVIGSRYVDGGSVPDDWGVFRKVISKCANFATRKILGIRGVNDCSGGFRAINTSLLEKINLDSLDVDGYAFQAVILESAIHNGGVVEEIPIHFNDREKGTSKMRIKDMVEGFTVLGKLRLKRMTRPTTRKRRITGKPEGR